MNNDEEDETATVKSKLEKTPTRPTIKFSERSLEPFDLEALPKIVTSEQVHRLTDLAQSKFEMNIKDRDFELSHEQVIKCVRILLTKINYLTKKTTI